MKELSIQEKAQRYDKALEAIKSLQEVNPSDEGIQNWVNENFPELKESEDEKIRKELIENFKWFCGDESETTKWGKDDNLLVKDILAWLEKQGTSYTKRDVDDAYLKGVTDTKNEIEKQYEANYQIRKDIATFIFNYRGDIKDRAKWMDYLGIKVSFVEKKGKQKPAFDIDIPFGAKDSELIEASYYIPEGFHAEIEGNNVVIKKGEQKPQGKTALEAIKEEKVDNANKVEPRQEELTEFERAVKQVMEEAIECGDTHNLKADANMLLSLVHKSDWSEEDRKKVNSLCVLLDQMVSSNMLSNKDTTEFKDWLKSLKERYTWKPSDKQMRTLEHYMHTLVCNEHKEILFGLYADLKKLREE